MGLTEVDEAVHVYCRSSDKGPVVRKICTAGCIACKICEKDDDTGAVKVIDNLAVVDYAVHKEPLQSTQRCPTKVIRVSEEVPGFKKKIAAISKG
jgi:electron transport complex protein RnfB